MAWFLAVSGHYSIFGGESAKRIILARQGGF
jgi:hypothetical protein